MADASLGHGRFDGKPIPIVFNTYCYPTFGSTSQAVLVDGLVQHDYVDPDVQVAILMAIDETGSASLGDIVAALPGHPKPASAALAMVTARILRINSGIVDANICLSRAMLAAADTDAVDHTKSTSSAPDTAGAGEAKVHEVLVPLYSPAIFWSSGTDRAKLRNEPLLARPAIYAAIWGRDFYAGASTNGAKRLSKGTHLLAPYPADRIIAIVDRSGQLTWEEAQVAERLLYRKIEAEGLWPRNREPNGGAVDASRYELVHDFVETAMVALRRERLLFPVMSDENGASRQRNRGSEGGTLFGKATGSTPPDTAYYRLDACGIEARARVDGSTWTVLADSQVRAAVAPSAHPSARQRRVELLHSGGLAETDADYVLTHDLAFRSATGAAHFLIGCKTRADIWKALDPAPASLPQR